MAKNSFPNGILSYSEAAQLLGCSTRTLQRYVAAGKIPESAIYRIASRVGFVLKGLHKIMREGGIK